MTKKSNEKKLQIQVIHEGKKGILTKYTPHCRRGVPVASSSTSVSVVFPPVTREVSSTVVSRVVLVLT